MNSTISPRVRTRRSRRPAPHLAGALAGLALLLHPAVGQAGVVVNCPFTGSSGDTAGDEAFYVSHYAANNLGKVEMRLVGAKAGPHAVSLAAHLGTFNGPLLGSAQVAAFATPVSCPPDCSLSAGTNVVFDFGGVAVPLNSTIAFITKVESTPGNATFFDVGSGPCPNVTETEDSTPPLSSFRRNSVGVKITAVDNGPCVADAATLCLDAAPNDRRFRVTMTAHTIQAGGKTVEAHPVPLKSLGITHGGVFWLFAADNPEMLVKVLDGCGVNNRQWVFASAGTNVGFTLSVFDTLTRAQRSYSNVDLHGALPILDTTVGLPCPE